MGDSVIPKETVASTEARSSVHLGSQSNDSTVGSAVRAPSPSSVILQDLEELLKRAKSFNIHMNVLKRLLNLKEPDEGYAFADTDVNYVKVLKTDATTKESAAASTSYDIDKIQEKMTQFRKELSESQALSFCLAYNVQRMQKLLTGLALDANAADDVVQDLWRKFNASKTNECILKYEFEEKRRLLKRLRRELEQARRDWKHLKIRISAPTDTTRNKLSNSSSSDDNEWVEATDANNATANLVDSDSAVHSDEGDESSHSSSGVPSIFESRSQQLDVLERECLDFVTQMITQDPTAVETPVSVDDEEESDRELFHSPIPVQLLVEALATSDEDDLDYEDYDSHLVDNDGDSDGFDSEEARTVSSDGGLDDSSVMSSSALTTTESMSSQLTLLTPEAPVTTDATGRSVMRSRASSRSSRTEDEDDEETRRLREESLAETGEPLVLCRLRRRAVEVLVSRLREEKAFHESREKELEQKLSESHQLNQQLRRKLLSLVTVGDQDNKSDLHANSFISHSMSSSTDSVSPSSSSSMSQSNNMKIFSLGVGFTLLALNVFYGVKMLS